MPYNNHAYPVKHPFKDCMLTKEWLSNATKKGEQKKKAKSSGGDVEEKQDDFT